MNINDIDGFLRKSAKELREELDAQIDDKTGGKIEFLINQAWIGILGEQDRVRSFSANPFLVFGSGALSALLAVLLISNLSGTTSNFDSSGYGLLQYSSLELFYELEQENSAEADSESEQEDSVTMVPGFGSIRFDSFEFDALEESELDDTQDNFSA